MSGVQAQPTKPADLSEKVSGTLNAKVPVSFSETDHSRAALEFVQQLLATPASADRPLDEVLRGLAAAFGASGAGLAGPWGDAPVVRQRVCRDADTTIPSWPWESDASVLER